ncbi:anillin-like isoform 2-T2 [Discoglossus pictus]
MMETRRQPLKRLCSESSNESPRKRRFTLTEEEAENCAPVLQPEYSPKSRWSTLLRIAEQEIKPDTPAIPSIKSRIQRLREFSSKDGIADSEGDSDNVGDKSWTEDSSLLAESGIRGDAADGTVRLDIRSVVEKFEWKPGMEEQPPLPIAQSTIGPRRPLPSLEDLPPSEETASRLRQERDKELAMVCAVLDRGNPWRAESMRQRQRKNEQRGPVESSRERRRRRVRTGRGRVTMAPTLDTQTGSSESDSENLSLDGSEQSLDYSEERSVSSLEVRLGSAQDSDSCRGSSPLPQERETSKQPQEDLNGDSCGGSGPLPQEAEASKQPEEDLNGGMSSDAVDEVRSQMTMDNSELIDRLFEGVLNSSEGSEEERVDEMDLPPVSVLSPLTKSIDMHVSLSPLNSVVSSLPEILVDAPETPRSSHDESNLLYSIDAYRTLRRNVQGEQGAKHAKLQKDPPGQSQTESAAGDSRERIKVLSKEVSSLQHIMQQACRALSCCVDAEHGKGTRQEAEAERLLLVSMEKRKALLKELERLRGDRTDDPDASSSSGSPSPCSGTITISNIRLPLKVDYVCSTIRESGLPGHYFLLLIRYGAYDIVATPLASAADAQTGDTILFPTTVTLNEASSDFKIEIEVYSLAQVGAITLIDKRRTSKPKITPKKLLGSRKSNMTSPACSPAVSCPVRPSNFLLVGSLTLSLESLGKFRFPLEKVPFLSPLEGNLYLNLQCQSHSTVNRRGFLTMFEDVSGLGSWHRRWCVLSGNCLSFWTYPDQESCKEPLGQINLANCTSAAIEPATRESCARPHTLELVTMRPQREDDTTTLVTQCRNTLCFTKNWLSADTKEERNLWMENLNQVLVDLRTWRSSPVRASPSPQGWQGVDPPPSEPAVKECDY